MRLGDTVTASDVGANEKSSININQLMLILLVLLIYLIKIKQVGKLE